MSKALVVFGASSFTGRSLIRSAVQASYFVRAISRREVNLPLSRPELVEWKLFNSADNEFDTFFSKINAQTAIYLAAPNGNIDASSIGNATEACIINFTRFIEAAKKANCKKIIYTGSYWQYDENGSKANPNNLYSAMKNSMDEIAAFYAHKLDIINLILFDSFGIGDDRKKIWDLINNAAKNETSLKLTKGEQFIAPIYIDDVANAILVAANNPIQIGCKQYWVPGSQIMSLKYAIEIYCKIMSLDPDLEWGGIDYLPSQIYKPYIGSLLPNWRPYINFEDGLRLMKDIA